MSHGQQDVSCSYCHNGELLYAFLSQLSFLNSRSTHNSTQIDIQCQRGGLDSITVTDNGIGISPRDLPLACTRFATSKLVNVDDLKSISTFGFRGEALASSSMVARVGITSRVRQRNKTKLGASASASAATADQEGDGCSSDDDDDDGTPQYSNCAYKMQYKDGKPNPTTNPNSKPKPSAGREGTVIQVQDLFYNIPSRRRALEGNKRSEREEYDRILSVVQRYAVHEAKRGVGFLCRGGGSTSGGAGKGKKSKGGFGGGNHTDLNTQSLASVKKLQAQRKRGQQQQSSVEDQLSATKDVIGHIFGTAVTQELLPLTTGEGDVEAVSLAALKAMIQKNGSDAPSASNDNDIATDGNDRANESNKGELQVGNDSFTTSLLEEMMMGGNEDNGSSDLPKESNDESNDDATIPDNAKHNASTSKFAFAYKARGLITNGSYTPPKSSTAFLLFINDRLVESSSIRRAVESVYADTLPKGGKPFVYLSLELPGPHVDVNVHPTKREVAFLHEDRLCDAVCKAVREVIGGATASRMFSVANGGRLLPSNEGKRSTKQQQQQHAGNPMSREKQIGKENTKNTGTNEPGDVGKASCLAADTAVNASTNNTDDAVDLEVEQSKSTKKTPMKRSADELKPVSTATKRPYYDPSRLVRTSRALPVGALEPFLVQKEPKAGSEKKAANPSALPLNATATDSTTMVKHKPGCPLANNDSSEGEKVDMSMPGAFASAICRCQVERSETLPPAQNNGIVVRANANNNVIRPKKITPTPCDYESICHLREEITNQNHQSLNETLRGSTYVGAYSRSRCLIQCGIDLIMINHRELARETFYQIALLKFGSVPMAKIGSGGVDVMSAISQWLQFEEDLNSLSSDKPKSEVALQKVNKTNADLARQATMCLAEKAPMLEEYFSIKLEKVKVYSDKSKQKKVTSLRITGLPILLDGHNPSPQGLPLFLLRLATEVDWTEEQSCFKGACTELASFYSELPFDPNADPNDAKGTNPDYIDDEAKKYVKHTLFPAISFLLVPPASFANDGAVIKLANLTSLYKVFERC